MKHIKKVFQVLMITAFLLFTGQGCIDLEEDTRSIFLLEELQSEADVMAALSPIYRYFSNFMSSPNSYGITGYGSDDMTTWWAGNKAPLRVFDRFDYGDGENSDIDMMPDNWNVQWKIIYFCNSLINGLKTATVDEEIIALADAEARFFRAMTYLNLVKGWGNMPLILDGDPPTGEETRASVLENYQAIEADLKIAETALLAPTEVDGNDKKRASTAAAKAVLADLYLTWAGWPVKDQSKYALAAAKAKEIIDMNYFELLPIDKLWLLESQNSKESIFAAQFSKSENIRSDWPEANSFHEARGYSDLYPERQFFYDFPEGPRKDITFCVNIPQRTVVNGVIVENGTKTWQKSQRNHPMYRKFTLAEDLTVDKIVAGFRAQEVYRYAEILLIYAEAWARSNGGTATGLALEAYNQVVRRAAGLPYKTPNGTVDKLSVTADEIVQEKAWELAGEFKRWNDLVRLEKVADISLQRDPTEEVPLVKSGSQITWKQYIGPIPFSTISTSKVVQNPEGFKILPDGN